MDVSPEYVKMCKKAEEIQKGHMGNWEICCPEYYDDCVWLPRQDQLQAMLKDVTEYWELRSYPCLGRLDKELPYEFLLYSDTLHEFTARTMEQLWLTVIMKALYDKVWSGTEWEEKA